MFKIPYERIVQWIAGPVAILAGYLATQLTTHVGVFGTLGLGKDQIAHAVLDVGVFVTGAIVTYAAHHKWLSNLPKWWDKSVVGPFPQQQFQGANFVGNTSNTGLTPLQTEPTSRLTPDLTDQESPVTTEEVKPDAGK